jgi:quinol monooxygenase YgiN
MAIYETGAYQIRPSAAEKLKRAIRAFVEYLQTNESGTEMYLAWQQKDDPTRFLHLFRFKDNAASRLHGESNAVKNFEAVYRPELVGGDVVFTEYEMVAGKLTTDSRAKPPHTNGRTDERADPANILRNFYTAALNRDFSTLRSYLHDNLVFVGLFETYRSADEYLQAFSLNNS